MAIYHLSAKVVSRTSGRSAVAAAAYRSGERLLDARTGLAQCGERAGEADAVSRSEAAQGRKGERVLVHAVGFALVAGIARTQGDVQPPILAARRIGQLGESRQRLVVDFGEGQRARTADGLARRV